MQQHAPSPNPPSKPQLLLAAGPAPRDEVLLACRRYNALVALDPEARQLKPLVWRGIAIRLWIASTRVQGDRVNFLTDRSNDAHQRADHARAVGAAGRGRAS